MGRATVATQLRPNGVPREDVQELLGRSSSDVTALYEQGDGDDAARRSAAQMDRLLRGENWSVD